MPCGIVSMRVERADVVTQVARVVVPPAWRWAAEEVLSGVDALPLYAAATPDLWHGPHADDVVAIATDGPVEPALLELPRLRLISFSGTGVWELVDIAEAAARGIAVCNIRDYATDAVAEHTWALILATARRVVAADAAVRSQLWPGPPWGRGLAGLTLGLLGVGSVGRRVAELGRAFGMRVVAYGARRESGSSADGLLTFSTRAEVLRVADVISVHGRYEPGAAPLLGSAEIAALKPGAIVVNTARGALVDADALAAAVSSGAVWGAGLDVFDTEPLPVDSTLPDVPGILLTPHVAAATEEAQRDAVRQCLDNITQFLEGSPRNVINPRHEGSST